MAFLDIIKGKIKQSIKDEYTINGYELSDDKIEDIYLNLRYDISEQSKEELYDFIDRYVEEYVRNKMLNEEYVQSIYEFKDCVKYELINNTLEVKHSDDIFVLLKIKDDKNNLVLRYNYSPVGYEEIKIKDISFMQLSEQIIDKIEEDNDINMDILYETIFKYKE